MNGYLFIVDVIYFGNVIEREYIIRNIPANELKAEYQKILAQRKASTNNEIIIKVVDLSKRQVWKDLINSSKSSTTSSDKVKCDLFEN